MRTWSRKNSLSGVKFRSEMDAHEAAVLRSLVESVIGLLDERESSAPQDELAALTGLRTGNSESPDNPVLARLLPDFHRPDPDKVSPDPDDLDDAGANVNGALRSLHEPEIIDAKKASGRALLASLPETGGKILLTQEQADAWLSALNDVRLALGTNLGIDADTPESLDPDDPRAPHLDVYHWLTWMQDSLVQALMP
ncbi:hypothetical protein B2J88_24775 [Rhodococcus sp. SRB_17]|uniref:oxidative stress transcriptional regulator AosR n=1 Tax=Rhodococcus sp. OK302 TaxID=1882769 RepID=UPI000B941AB7|nr:DUF2017 domain-containing protein [Rhodococcus sp. OK302]NMM87529.1 hypothetical protein [Rhodococcus sp. SRB_17]OYD71243.1 uncharacterized protein DUF2017 [Rhodococcus sp. OK302]